uniref:Pectin methylesterase inhibitor 3 n=1 Tax=Cunninghamia lanceolata TaxID=28977 RepID=A0A6G9W386_CUNLA|nr:pectin methylesterase inhibitor 3 [Cunninghamia lanceolata]
MDSSTLFSLFIIAAILISTAEAKPQGGDFVNSSCKITPYPDVCVASLSPYTALLQAKKSQTELAKAAVKDSLTNARDMTAWAVTLSRRSTGLSKRERSALHDCVENFGETSDQISQSLSELKHLRPQTFKFQISNVQTWMSAALTNEDSCLDGFQAVRDGRVKKLVQERVQNAEKLISNALALVIICCMTEDHHMMQFR